MHYSIPTDPNFVISSLKVYYQDVVVEGIVKEKEVVKAEFKAANDQGQTVMMANYSQSEASILKIRIGNIEPMEQVKV